MSRTLDEVLLHAGCLILSLSILPHTWLGVQPSSPGKYIEPKHMGLSGRPCELEDRQPFIVAKVVDSYIFHRRNKPNNCQTRRTFYNEVNPRPNRAYLLLSGLSARRCLLDTRKNSDAVYPREGAKGDHKPQTAPRIVLTSPAHVSTRVSSCEIRNKSNEQPK